jgi:hypothetical protein
MFFVEFILNSAKRVGIELTENIHIKKLELAKKDLKKK